ncbi:MAG TPA: Do family serine endopeptidase [Bacteroidales bacterium]|nr:Do family serine endopeptidase [Bacteroidales bacterium]
MKTFKYSGIFISALAGAIMAVLISNFFFPKKQIVYNYPGYKAQNVSYDPGAAQPIDFTIAAEQTVHAVVNVRTKAKNENQFVNPLYYFFYGQDEPVQQPPKVGIGSGVIIDPNGYIVTNNHVIQGANEIVVTLNDNREFTAKLIGADPSTDLALLKVEANNLPVIPYGNSEELRLGQWVLAIGNPYNLSSTVTAGIVSAKARNLNIINDNYRLESFIQTDAALNPGNSGGALVNTKGELVGVNTAILSVTGGYSGNSFAIPVTIVKKVVDDLREFGAVQRAFLGITPADVNAEIAKQNNLSITTGVFVADVKETGAAKEAGIKANDVITKINNVPVVNTSELQEQLSKYRPGQKISVTILRNDNLKDISVTLRNLQGETKLLKPNDITTTIMGATLSDITEEDKKNLGIKYGVKIVSLSPGKFSKAGIEEGFIITRLNNKAVTSVAEMKKIINNTRGGLYIEGIYSNGVIAYYAFGL